MQMSRHLYCKWFLEELRNRVGTHLFQTCVCWYFCKIESRHIIFHFFYSENCSNTNYQWPKLGQRNGYVNRFGWQHVRNKRKTSERKARDVVQQMFALMTSFVQLMLKKGKIPTSKWSKIVSKLCCRNNGVHQTSWQEDRAEPWDAL